MRREPLIAELKDKYGPLLGPNVLASMLYFKNYDSCERTLRSGALDVPAFRLPGRPGHFVFTEEFVDWLLASRRGNPRQSEMPAAQLEEDAHP